MNVLEVMKDAAAALRNGEYPGTSQELMEARVAVAELIEAAAGLRFDVFELTSPELRTMFDGHKQIAAVHMETVRHLRAALARVKGVQS
jgi:hypothetical protein